jgi:hypothetical protein
MKMCVASKYMRKTLSPLSMSPIQPRGNPRRGWVDNIKTDLVDIGWDGMDWIGLAHDRSCERGNETWGSIKYWETIE